MLLSVVIPVYNNTTSLVQCVRSFTNAKEYLDDMEFIVVDDGSDTPVDKQASGIFSTPGINIQSVRIHHRGAASARNEGMLLAKGDYVWFFDADDSVEPTAFARMMETLKEQGAEVELLHTGPMVSEDQVHRSTLSATRSTTPVFCSLDDIFVPRSAYLDHTTYIIRRTLFEDCPTLRYPERNLLEDSQFVLQLLDKADGIHCNETLQPYIRHKNPVSSTSGPWSAEKSATLVPDICDFFEKFDAFLNHHPEIGKGENCYRRLRYVYMRVLCVKGCPWTLIEQFCSSTLHNYPYRTAKELLFFRTPFSRMLAFLCRKLLWKLRGVKGQYLWIIEN